MATVMTSCELETSKNGKLDGMWHLVSVDTLSTGGFNDMTYNKVYWSFQGKLLQIDDKTGARASVFFRFNHQPSSLDLSDPHIKDRMNGDPVITDVKDISPFGINALEEKFSVESLSSGKMILKSPTLRLYFRKM